MREIVQYSEDEDHEKLGLFTASFSSLLGYGSEKDCSIVDQSVTAHLCHKQTHQSKQYDPLNPPNPDLLVIL